MSVFAYKWFLIVFHKFFCQQTSIYCLPQRYKLPSGTVAPQNFISLNPAIFKYASSGLAPDKLAPLKSASTKIQIFKIGFF